MLTVAFNVFDGEEWLEQSIAGIAEVASEIILVWQNISNSGEAYEPVLPSGLTKIRYEPDLSKTPAKNELAKRNLGLAACRTPWFMSMDVDELYRPEEFARAFKDVREGGFDAAACQMLTYYYSPRWRLEPPESYYVPLMFRADGRRFESPCRWPVTVDPTRHVPSERIMLFARSQIQMHHMSYVRADIRRKLRNSSARKNYDAEKLAKWHEGWKPGDRALLPGGWHNVVEDLGAPLCS